MVLKDSDSQWISEAIVEFLKGPLYINPLMSFIDANCTIWTMEEENRIEYTPIHEEFKALVDELLTEFVTDLGLGIDEFYDILEKMQDKDKLTGFVIETILTVEDFSLFKSMMVKRNVDLTNQVLAAVDAMKVEAAAVKKVDLATSQFSPEEEAKMLDEVLKLSQVEGESVANAQRLKELMKALQLEDEDVAMAMAIANSLREQARMEGELAELEQAIAMSNALEEERMRQLQKAADAEEAAEDVKAKAKGASSSSAAPAPAPAAPAAPAAPKPFPARPAASSEADVPVKWAPLPQAQEIKAKPLDPINIGPNSAAERMAAVAAQAEANARALAAAVVQSSAASQQPSHSSIPSTTAAIGSVSLNSSMAPSAAAGGGGGGGGGSSLSNLPSLSKVAGSSAMSGRAPLPPSSGVPPISPLKPSEDVPSGNLIMRELQHQTTTNAFGSSRQRAAGYKEGTDFSSIRDAAQQAAITQRALLQNASDEKSQAWLMDQKQKLVAQKQLEREAEMAQYKAHSKGQGRPSASGGANVSGSELDAKRAALRDKLAQRIKEQMIA